MCVDCRTDADCPLGEVCEHPAPCCPFKRCVPKPKPKPGPKPKPCKTDADCPPGYFCKKLHPFFPGTCVPKPKAKPWPKPQPCKTDADCKPGEKCLPVIPWDPSIMLCVPSEPGNSSWLWFCCLLIVFEKYDDSNQISNLNISLDFTTTTTSSPRMITSGIVFSMNYVDVFSSEL